MVVRREARLFTFPNNTPDFKIWFDKHKEIYMELLTEKSEIFDCLGIDLTTRIKGKQEIVYYKYQWDDTENDLFQIILEINFLINDPNVEYFLCAAGNLRQEYDSDILDVYVGINNVSRIFSLLGSVQGDCINRTYKRIKDANSGQTRVEEM